MTWVLRVAVLFVCILVLMNRAPSSQERLALRLQPLAITPDEFDPSDTIREELLPLDPFETSNARTNTVTPLTDGRPLRADQSPRFLRPTHTGNLGFYNFLVVGDYPTVDFERYAYLEDTSYISETWVRAAIQYVDVCQCRNA